MEYARKVLMDIANGKKKITMPVYNYGTKPNSTRTVTIDNDVNMVIVEGIFLFYELDKHLQNVFDYLIFVEVVDDFPNVNLDLYSKSDSMLHYFSNNKQDEIQIFLRRFYRDKRYRKDSFGYIEFLYIWENIMVHLVSGNLPEHINGVSIGPKKTFNIIKIWTSEEIDVTNYQLPETFNFKTDTILFRNHKSNHLHWQFLCLS